MTPRQFPTTPPVFWLEVDDSPEVKTSDLKARLAKLDRVGYYQLDAGARRRHGAITRELRRRELRENDVLLSRLLHEEFQGIGSDLLQMAIERGLDLNRIAKDEMACRGLDQDGEWISFVDAKKLWK